MNGISDLDEVMAHRAAALARAQAEDDQPETPTVEVVTVEVAGGTRWAFETRHVREVMRNEHLRRLPGGAGALLGVMAARGEVVPVADLGALLGLCAPSPTRSMVVIVDDDGSPLGLLVDDVTEVTAWRTTDLRTVATTSRHASDGIVHLGPHDTVVLDGAALLHDARLFVTSPPIDSAARRNPEQELD